MDGWTRAGMVWLVTLAATLAGCAEEGAPAAEGEEEPTVVTSPDDYTYVGNATFQNGGHIHDYWGGQETKVIFEMTLQAPLLWIGDEGTAHAFRGGFGEVVPQGAASVNVTISWDRADTDTFAEPLALWVKTAADNEPQFVSDVQNGDTVLVPSDNDRNDLPHQTLSAWSFDVRAAPEPEAGGLGVVSFESPVTMRVEATRGLLIPVYPAHADRWQGQTEMRLFSVQDQSAFFDGDTTTEEWRCYGGCPQVFTPDDGVVVPWDASHIVATLTLDTQSPTTLGLAYHGGEARAFVRGTPESEEGGVRSYRIPVADGAADGPYALQSLWEFVVFVDAPQEDGYVVNQYDLQATVYREAE